MWLTLCGLLALTAPAAIDQQSSTALAPARANASKKPSPTQARVAGVAVQALTTDVSEWDEGAAVATAPDGGVYSDRSDRSDRSDGLERASP